MRHKVTDMLKIDSEGSYVRKLDLEDAIVDWRVCLREKQFLVRDSIIHYSISGRKIHGLVNFTKKPNANRITDFRRHFLQQDFLDDLSLKRPVFVTNTEAEHYEAKKNYIQIEIPKRGIEENKAAHIQFFNEVIELVNEAFVSSNNSCEESEDSDKSN